MFISLMCALSAQAAVIQVTSDKSGTELQEAINGAKSGDSVLVQAGTYYGNFTMKEGVNVIGGWDANFETQADYATILDAQKNGRVLEQPSNFTTWTIWSNFTVQNGKLTAKSNIPAAGLSSGVALGKKGRVQHCLIQNNTFDYNDNCMGGGVGNDAVDANTDVCAEDCIIRNNCGTHGGGARVRGTLLNCVIENNNTNNSIKKGPAGGVHLHGGRMVNCIVRGVGGVGIENANSDIIGCTIVNNDQLVNDASHNSKCGISCGATSDNGTKLANNVVWGNKHKGVVQEAQVYYISHYAAANRIYNAITHQNTTNGIKLSMNNDENDTYTDNDSNEQTGRAPHFADPANGDYRLTWQSPMLGRANSSIAVVTKDLDGNNRNIEGVDLGAYELPYYTLTIDAFDHATLTIGEDEYTAGEYSVPMPKGYTADATITPEDGYELKSVTLNDEPLVPAEEVYTLPALTANVVLAIVTEEKEATAIDNAEVSAKAHKVISNGQLMIIRNGEIFNALGSKMK